MQQNNIWYSIDLNFYYPIEVKLLLSLLQVGVESQCCDQAKHWGSVFAKGAPQSCLQSQPDSFQGPLDWPILPYPSELSPPETSWAESENCYLGRLSFFKVSQEFQLFSLLLKCDRAECDPRVFISLFEVKLPEAQAIFLNLLF